MDDIVREMYEDGDLMHEDERIEYRGYIIKKAHSKPAGFEIYDSIGELAGVVWPSEHGVREGFAHELDTIIDNHDGPSE